MPALLLLSLVSPETRGSPFKKNQGKQKLTFPTNIDHICKMYFWEDWFSRNRVSGFPAPWVPIVAFDYINIFGCSGWPQKWNTQPIYDSYRQGRAASTDKPRPFLYGAPWGSAELWAPWRTEETGRRILSLLSSLHSMRTRVKKTGPPLEQDRGAPWLFAFLHTWWTGMVESVTHLLSHRLHCRPSGKRSSSGKKNVLSSCNAPSVETIWAPRLPQVGVSYSDAWVVLGYYL